MATLEETVAVLVNATEALIQSLETKVSEFSATVDAAIAAISSAAHAISIPNAVFAGGVTTGKPVYRDVINDNFGLAVADGSVAGRAVGFAEITEERVYTFGETPPGMFAGLTPGARYYLSADTPGGITTVPPLENVTAIGIALTATTMFVDFDSGVMSTPSPFSRGTLAYAANITPNFNNYTSYDITATGDFTLELPTLRAGQTAGTMEIDVTASGAPVTITLGTGLIAQDVVDGLVIPDGDTFKITIKLLNGTAAHVYSDALAAGV